MTILLIILITLFILSTICVVSALILSSRISQNEKTDNDFIEEYLEEEYNETVTTVY